MFTAYAGWLYFQWLPGNNQEAHEDSRSLPFRRVSWKVFHRHWWCLFLVTWGVAGCWDLLAFFPSHKWFLDSKDLSVILLGWTEFCNWNLQVWQICKNKKSERSKYFSTALYKPVSTNSLCRVYTLFDSCDRTQPLSGYGLAQWLKNMDRWMLENEFKFLFT